jgi:uncharacterized protein (TIGR02118 family)
MIKLIFCLRRLPSLDRDQFLDYWEHVHAPIVAARADVLRIRRYVQSYTFQDLGFSAVSNVRGNSQPYDGVAELWWDTIEDCLGRTDPAARRAGREILEDERKFVDLSASPIFLSREHEIVPFHPAVARSTQAG